MLKVISVCHDKTHAQPLIQSLEKHGWNWTIIETEWRGFGTKLIETYHYLKANPDITHFVFVDAFDVIALATPEEFESKIVHKDKLNTSAEKGLWPPILQPFRSLYTQSNFGFDYPNSGCYYAPSSEFIRLFEKYPPFYEIDDQFWMNMLYLNNEICLDASQYLFNSHSFIADGEYQYIDGRVLMKTGTPCFIHSNARTVDPKLNEMLNNLK